MFVIFRNQNEQPKNVKPVLILVTRPEIWECKSPFTIYSDESEIGSFFAISNKDSQVSMMNSYKRFNP